MGGCSYANGGRYDHEDGRGQEVVGGHPQQMEVEAAQEYRTRGNVSLVVLKY